MSILGNPLIIGKKSASILITDTLDSAGGIIRSITTTETPQIITPLNVTFQSKVVGYGIGGTRPTYHHEIRGGFVPPPPIYRSRPRSNSYNERQMEETEYQYNTSCVCTKCGKEF